MFEKILFEWKKSETKKPLMVVGVRQIGKTYTIDKFCKENFTEYLYFNLEKNNEIKNIFDKTIDEEKILEELELHIGKKINLEETVFFFDEIQVSENFIVSLKYFCESEKPYKIICAGSLLGVKINRFNSSFPVGKVRIEYMYPMNFEEFLMAAGKDLLLNKIRTCYSAMEVLPELAHEQALTLYRQYLCIGGMPEAVNDFIENDLDVLRYDSKITSNIVDMYIADMKKYVISSIESVKIEKVYKNIPRQLSKETKTFQYNLIEEGGRKRKYETPIEWLVSSGMILCSNKIKKAEIPLKVYIDEDMFKLYLSDVGLLTALSEIKYPDIMLERPFMFKGAITENYIAQQFISKGLSLYYWTSERNAEVDFLIYNNDGVIPVEVKSKDNVQSRSLNLYMTKNNPKYAIRLSTKNFGFANNIKSIPLYATFCIE